MWWWCSLTKSRSNLERFLYGVTPKPASHSLPQPKGKPEKDCFKLSDLWDWFDEPSAYGFGTKVDLNNGESVMQYYVPYLSAIQIYKPATTSKKQGEGSESSECWSSDSGSEKLLARSMSNDSNKTWDVISEDSVYDPEGFISLLLREGIGSLEFSYVESDLPHKRIPLTDKMNVLAEKYPGLMTLRNVDLSPASWIAVAWYPIYHIPSCGSGKDLSACFLTYHTLSSAFRDNSVEVDYGNDNKGKEDLEYGEEYVKRIPLPSFGFATYKMQGDLLINKFFDQERLFYLQTAVDSWLSQLNVDHADYNFFARSASRF